MQAQCTSTSLCIAKTKTLNDTCHITHCMMMMTTLSGLLENASQISGQSSHVMGRREPRTGRQTYGFFLRLPLFFRVSAFHGLTLFSQTGVRLMEYVQEFGVSMASQT